jgi:hypothetical protein
MTIEIIMKDGEKCEICSVVYKADSIIRYKPVGRSNFRFQCDNPNLVVPHRYTIDGKLYRRTKRIYNADRCPVCGYHSGIVGTPKTGAHCHMCKARFRLEGNIVVLTGLGKFRDIPHWFTGLVEIDTKD